jgi:hypothetical protein
MTSVHQRSARRDFSGPPLSATTHPSVGEAMLIARIAVLRGCRAVPAAMRTTVLRSALHRAWTARGAPEWVTAVYLAEIALTATEPGMPTEETTLRTGLLMSAVMLPPSACVTTTVAEWFAYAAGRSSAPR